MKQLFYNGKILTMADPLYVEALLTENDKILATGTKEELLALAPDCELVDLKGKALLPGFIDPHSHFAAVANALLRASLEEATSVEEIRDRVQAFIKKKNLQPGEWICALNYDNNLLPDEKNPTLEQLDWICPDHPLMISHKSGHMGLVNSMAMEKLGITVDTPSPEGGRIGKKNGKLTGYLEENAFFAYMTKAGTVDFNQLMESMDDTQDLYASYGITTVQEGLLMKDLLPLYEAFAPMKKLKLDVMLYADPGLYEKTEEVLKKADEPHLHLCGIKVLLDGSPQGRTAWTRQPYEGSDDYCAYGTLTDEDLEKAFIFAGEHKTQLLAHCNGDGASEQYLNCLERAEKKVPWLAESRPVIIHGQLMGRDQMPRAAKLGAMVSFFVAHVYHWGDIHIKNFGMERAKHISAARTALDCGVKFTFHQDCPVLEPDMMETVWCAVNRITRKGVHLGSDEESISTLEALKAITVNGAYQYFAEDRIGTLEPGKQADMVMLEQDPLETPKEELNKVKVLRTYKNGACIYSCDKQ